MVKVRFLIMIARKIPIRGYMAVFTHTRFITLNTRYKHQRGTRYKYYILEFLQAANIILSPANPSFTTKS